MDIDKIEDVIVLNGAHSFEMIKDVGLVKDIASRDDTRSKMGTHGIGPQGFQQKVWLTGTMHTHSKVTSYQI